MKVEEIHADYTTLPDTGAATSDWHRAKLGDIAQVIRGVTYKKEQATSQPATDMLPILRATNVQDGSLVLDSDLVFVPKELVSETQKLRVGDIVVATSSGSKHLVGKTAQVREAWEGSFGAFCAAIRPTGDIDQRYLGYFFETREYKDYISKKALGVNINNLRRGDLEEISVPVAPLDQQKRIVAEIEKQFSRLDEAVANLKRVKANLKRYKAAVLKAAVEGHLVETEAERARREGRSYETGAQLLQRILETRRSQWQSKGKYKEPAAPDTTDLPDLPEGWVWATIEQLTWLVTSGSRGWGDYYSDDGVLFIRAQDIKTDSLNIHGVARVTIPTAAEGTRSSVSSRDILITITGANVTKSALVQDLGEIAFVSQHVALLKLNQPEMAPFIFNWIVSPSNGRKFLESWAYGAGKPGLSLEQVRSLPVAVPPFHEQHRIVADIDRRLSVLRETEAQVDANLQRAERLRYSILSRAFFQKLNNQTENVGKAA